MPTDIKLKNSVTATNAPTSLQQGEVAINITDKKVWVGNAATTPVLLLGSGADGTFTNLTVSGVASFADGTVSLPSITNIGDTNTGIFFPAADTIAFTEGGVESMRINSAGQVGIGTNNPFARLTVSGSAANLYVDVSGENYYDASAHIWRTFAGTERMRIDSSGNVGIGTSSPVARLNSVASANNGTALRLDNPTTSNGYSELLFSVSGLSSSSGYSSYIRATSNPTADFSSFLTFGTSASATNAPVERMRIDSSGNLLVGATSPAANSSNTIVGTFNTAVLALAVVHNASNSDVRGILASCPNYSGNDGYLYIGNAGGSDKFYVRTSGNVQNSNNSYGAISDVKLKENIVDATSKLDKLMQVKVRSYNLKADPTHKQIGVVAQELEEVFPNLVEEIADRDADNKDAGTTTKSVKYSVFVPILIKAIQEQQALIETLTTRLNALEGK